MLNGYRKPRLGKSRIWANAHSNPRSHCPWLNDRQMKDAGDYTSGHGSFHGNHWKPLRQPVTGNRVPSKLRVLVFVLLERLDLVLSARPAAGGRGFSSPPEPHRRKFQQPSGGGIAGTSSRAKSHRLVWLFRQRSPPGRKSPNPPRWSRSKHPPWHPIPREHQRSSSCLLKDHPMDPHPAGAVPATARR